MSTSAMIAPRKTSRVPVREVELEPEHVHAALGLAEERVEPADRERADDGAPQAVIPPKTSMASVRNVSSR